VEARRQQGDPGRAAVEVRGVGTQRASSAMAPAAARRCSASSCAQAGWTQSPIAAADACSPPPAGSPTRVGLSNLFSPIQVDVVGFQLNGHPYPSQSSSNGIQVLNPIGSLDYTPSITRSSTGSGSGHLSFFPDRLSQTAALRFRLIRFDRLKNRSNSNSKKTPVQTVRRLASQLAPVIG
jgi:hypothetical protein